jgi:hypothetical protein
MPSTKGNNGVWNIIMLPFNTAASVVFYPAHFSMWLIVDVLGKENVTLVEREGQKQKKTTLRFPRLMQIWGMRDLVKFVKEFRNVLYDHYGWKRVKTSPSGWKCKTCSKVATWFCVDCNKKYCPQCCYNLHIDFSQTHSIEEIVPEKKAHIHFITPLLPQLILAVFLYYSFVGVTFVTEQYTTAQNTCPMVTQARTVIGSIDPYILHHYKKHLLSCCDIEDTYVRFILDAWVRTIVLETDNTALVFQALPQAFLFHLALEYTIVPALAAVCAIVLNVCYQIECKVPPNDTLKLLENVAKSWNLSSFIFGDRVFDLAETEPRRRDPLDFMD